jgi:flagellar protein FlgJ
MDETKTLPAPAIAQIKSPYQQQQADRPLKKAGNPTGASPADSELKAACQEMESLFVNHLFKEMRATIHQSGLISGGRAEEIFTSMLDSEMSRKISASRGIGLSQILFEQLSRKSIHGRVTDPEE